jgi:hypothetical protein
VLAEPRLLPARAFWLALGDLQLPAASQCAGQDRFSFSATVCCLVSNFGLRIPFPVMLDLSGSFPVGV